MKLRSTHVVAGLLCLSLSVTASAQDDQELSLAALMDIKLQTGSFLELDLQKSPVSMTIIDRTKVRVSGARNLSELLEVYVPGFQYMFNKWNGLLWGMRGVANDRNTKFIFLVNGHKMNTEARDGAFQETELGLLGDIERIEVLRGPSGLVYGSGAIAGIVNVVTRTGSPGTTEIQTDLGTATNFQQKSWGMDARMFTVPAEGHSLVATMGYRESEGLGNEETRIYGKGSWPFPDRNIAAGAPSDGSYGATPGNWRTSIDYTWKDLRFYGRVTHQVSEAGAFFILDPWADIMGAPDSTAPAVMIDGKTVSPRDDFWSQTESWHCARREYVADNIAADLTYLIPMGEDQIKLHGGFDGNANRIQREMRPGYETVDANERNSFYEETFGERRYTAGAMYLLKKIPALQLAAGAEQRWDDIGNDLSGRNSQAEKGQHRVVADVLYTNTALFTEGFYDVNEALGVGFGARWDGHTRTMDDGGTINGKLALVYTPAAGHIVKLIGQTSSNNGSADNYEFGRNNLNDLNQPYTTPHYEKPYELPGGNSNAIAGVTEAQLHELKPEKVYSFELTSSHQITSAISFSPSVSYNMVQDLFAWNQGLFRVVNAGSYNHLDVEGELSYSIPVVTVGVNHVFQRPINTDPEKEAVTFRVDRFTHDSTAIVPKAGGGMDTTIVQAANYKTMRDANGKVYYVPVANGKTDYTVNPVKEQITSDGENFLSLATNISKVFIDYHPTSWLTLHTDARIYWGLAGRDSIYAEDEAKGTNNWGITRDFMTKLNASALMELPNNLSIGVYVYNILGVDNGTSTDNDLAINTLRWQQTGTPDQKDLYAVDKQAFALQIQKGF